MFFQCLADPNAPTTTTQSPPSGNNFTIFHGYGDKCFIVQFTRSIYLNSYDNYRNLYRKLVQF